MRSKTKASKGEDDEKIQSKSYFYKDTIRRLKLTKSLCVTVFTFVFVYCKPGKWQFYFRDFCVNNANVKIKLHKNLFLSFGSLEHDIASRI